MAVRRAALNGFTRISRAEIPCRRYTQLQFPSQVRTQTVAKSLTSPALRQLRRYSQQPTQPKAYNFEDIQKLIKSSSPNRVLIDVREPDEYAAGYIPSALNMPITSHPDALVLPAHEFEDRFGFPKPEAEKEVVFYCKAGVRSAVAAKLAGQVGYEKIGEYKGSWIDWEKRGGEGAKP